MKKYSSEAEIWRQGPNKEGLPEGGCHLNLRIAGKELLWTLTLVSYLWLGSILLRSIIFADAVNPGLAYASLTMSVAVYISFGVILGLPALVDRWHTYKGFNWLKLVIQGFPALALGIPILLINRIFSVGELHLPWQSMTSGTGHFVVILAGVWFGKVLADSIRAFE
jgi:hypothetical protein